MKQNQSLRSGTIWITTSTMFDFITLFLPNVPFWSPWKHQKTKGFLMFSGGSKGNIGKKRFNMNHLKSPKLIIHPFRFVLSASTLRKHLIQCWQKRQPINLLVVKKTHAKEFNSIQVSGQYLVQTNSFSDFS